MYSPAVKEEMDNSVLRVILFHLLLFRNHQSIEHALGIVELILCDVLIAQDTTTLPQLRTNNSLLLPLV